MLDVKRGESQLLVQDDAKKRIVHLQPQPALVIDEAELSKLVHEVIHSLTGGTNHFRQSLLTHAWNHFLRVVLLSEA